jgi:hypothetical protein
MSRSGALDQIETLLGTVTDPALQGITRGEPLSIPAVVWCAYYLSGQVTMPEMATFGDESTITTVTVRLYFPAITDPQSQSAVETDIWDGIANVRTAILGDSDLGDNVSQLKMPSATVGYEELSGVWYRTTTQPIDLWILSDTTVSP